MDIGAEDNLNEGEYFYVDKFGSLEKGNEYTEKEDGVSIIIGLRAMYWFEHESEVLIEAEKK